MTEQRIIRQLPEFLGVGAAKGGTTWLHACLQEHPDIFMPGIELDFFSKHYEKGLAWYASQFSQRGDKRIAGDISPSYMVFPEALKRIHDWNPDVRLIFVFRNPVERAYSHYCMHLRGGLVSADVDGEMGWDTRYITEGMYYTHLRRFLQQFTPEQILVLLYDDLKADPAAFLQQVLRFLNVSPDFKPSLLNKAYHARKSRPQNQSLYNAFVRVARILKQNSYAGRQFVETVRRKGYVNILHRLNRGPDFPTMSRKKERDMALFFGDEVTALADLLQRDLSHWLSPYLEQEGSPNA